MKPAKLGIHFTPPLLATLEAIFLFRLPQVTPHGQCYLFGSFQGSKGDKMYSTALERLELLSTVWEIPQVAASGTVRRKAPSWYVGRKRGYHGASWGLGGSLAVKLEGSLGLLSRKSFPLEPGAFDVEWIFILGCRPNQCNT